jgi:hypothetical protein
VTKVGSSSFQLALALATHALAGQETAVLFLARLADDAARTGSRDMEDCRLVFFELLGVLGWRFSSKPDGVSVLKGPLFQQVKVLIKNLFTDKVGLADLDNFIPIGSWKRTGFIWIEIFL